MLHDIILILATAVTVIVLQRIARRAIYDWAARWFGRMRLRVQARRAGDIPPRRAFILDRMFTITEEDALDRLVNGDLDESTSPQVYADWLLVREAYDRHVGKRL